MASTGVNVLRWSALGAGVIYGIYHQASISSAARAAARQQEYEHKKQLIEKAKAEYSKKTQPLAIKTETAGVISDPNDSRFDLEVYLNSVATEAK